MQIESAWYMINTLMFGAEYFSESGNCKGDINNKEKSNIIVGSRGI